MRSLALKLDKDSKTRIKKRREELDLTQRQVADRSYISLNTYKNIERPTAGTRSVSSETLANIAHTLSCTSDYLLGEGHADEPSKNKDGQIMSFPIDRSEEYRVFDSIYDYLLNNKEFCDNLDYLINHIPFDKRETIIKGFNDVISTMRENTLIPYSDKVDPDTLNRMQMALRTDSTDLIEMVSTFSDAKMYYQRSQFKRALDCFFKLLCFHENKFYLNEDMRKESSEYLDSIIKQWWNKKNTTEKEKHQKLITAVRSLLSPNISKNKKKQLWNDLHPEDPIP